MPHWRDDVEALRRLERRLREQLALPPDAPPAVRASLERILQALDGERAGLETAMAAHLRQHSELRAMEQRLLTIPAWARHVRPLLVLLARYHTLTGGRTMPKGW